MSLTVYILDDEQNGIDVLDWHLKNIPDISVCATQTNPLVAIEEINSLRPQLLIMDIQMPNKNGFEVLEQLQKPLPEVIFVTAYDQFAIRAIRFSAADYLVKPIESSELENAILKVRNNIKQRETTPDLESLLYNIRMLHTQKPKLAVPSFDGIEYIPVDEIVYCQASDNYTNIILSDKRKVTASKTLKDFESMLAEHQFVRIHQSYMVNMNFIRKYIKADGGSVLLDNGDTLPISRAKKDVFLEKMGLL